MSMQPREALQLPRDGKLRSPSSMQLLLSSVPADWPNLLVQHYRYSATHTPVSLPARSEETILIPLSGAVTLNGAIEQPFSSQRLDAGTIFIVPQQLPSTWQWTDSWEALHLYLSPTLLTMVAADALGVDRLSVHLTAQHGVADALLHQLGLAFLAELQAGGVAGPHYVAALTQTLVYHLLRNYTHFQRTTPTSTPATGLSLQALRTVLDYIECHLSQPLAQADVAALVNLSAFHFARLFRQAMGQSLHQYILDRRVAATKQLLLAGHLTLAEIALRVGFTDQSHLTRHFKRHCGVTPKVFAQTRTNVQRERTIFLESGG